MLVVATVVVVVAAVEDVAVENKDKHRYTSQIDHQCKKSIHDSYTIPKPPFGHPYS